VSIYGTLITDTAVELAVIEQLQAWLPSYLVEAAVQDGLAEIALPRSYDTTRGAMTKWTEQALPAVVVQIGGTIGLSRKSGKYRAVYGCSVGAVVGGQTRANTRQLAGIYGLSIAAALCQQAGAWTDGIEWTDLDYDLIDEDRSRTLMAAIISLDVAVNGVLDVHAGPAGPAPAPGSTTPGLPDYGDAATVDTSLTLVKIGDPLP
jgi:hypothetical protein